MLRMASTFGGSSPYGGAGAGFGIPFGAPQAGFPAPGTPNANPASPANPSNPSTTTPGATPSSTTAPSAGSPPPLNPFGFNPSMVQQMQQMHQLQQMLAATNAMGQGAAAAGGWGGLGMGAPPVPTDTRPPEERFEAQLQASFSFFFRLIVIPFTDVYFLFPSIGYSNYAIWDSSTPPRMFVHSWRREGMFRVQLNIYSTDLVFSRDPYPIACILTFFPLLVIVTFHMTNR